MEKVLIVAVIVLPLVMFLALFSNNVLEDTESNASSAKSEAQKLMDLVSGN